MLYAACALLVCSIAAHPNFGRRHDLVDDDEPFARDADSDFDLIAEESEHYETVVATELPPTPPTNTRGRVRFSTADKQESVSNHRYTSPNRYRSRKASTTATPIASTQKPVESEKDERALMLVLPYDTRNLSESKIQELYTKAPMTWIINTTTTQAPVTKPQTERTSTTIVVTPTPEIKYYRKRITTTTTTQAPPPIRDNVKDVLASIGLFPDKQGNAQWKPVTTTQAPEFVKIATDSFSPDMINLLASFGLMPSDSKNEIPPPSAPEEPEQFDVPQSQPSFQAEIDPSSYSVFKPIPRTQEKQALSSDMKEFLASFGIVDDDNIKKEIIRPRGKQLSTRTEVTASPSEIPTLHPESMSNEMKDVLHSLGLVPHLTPEEITEKTTFQSRSINSEFIFNPTDSVHNSLNNSEDVENLKKLLGAFKSLASNTSTPEEIEKQLQEANLSQQNFTNIFGNNNNNINNNDKHSLTLDKYTNAPDPLSFEELLYAINETRNEIHKRQEAKNTSDTSSLAFDSPSSSTGGLTTVKISTTSTTTTTEAEDEPEESDSKNAASETKAEETSIGASSATSSTTENNAALLADLESSFGGNTGSSTIDEELPPARPNGFYFMLDWNSFLNVGEDDKGVNLKFAPRLGNSRNFLPITVP